MSEASCGEKPYTSGTVNDAKVLPLLESMGHAVAVVMLRARSRLEKCGTCPYFSGNKMSSEPGKHCVPSLMTEANGIRVTPEIREVSVTLVLEAKANYTY